MAALEKAEILAGLFSSWDQLDALLSGLTDQQWQTPTALPGWTVHDVVAHIVGTESFLMGVPTPEADCDVSELPHVHNPIAAMNECWVRHLRPESPQAMIDRFRAVTAERRQALADLSDEGWNEIVPTPVGMNTYGRFMRVRTFDCWMHEQDVRYAAGVWAADEVVATPAAIHALDEIVASLGFIVGKRGKAPDGSRIAFELTGPLQRTLRVAVEGRAKVVDDFGPDGPTSTIQLDAVLFTRLAGGRTTFADNVGAVVLSGDTEVGQRIAENLTFVI